MNLERMRISPPSLGTENGSDLSALHAGSQRLVCECDPPLSGSEVPRNPTPSTGVGGLASDGWMRCQIHGSNRLNLIALHVALNRRKIPIRRRWSSLISIQYCTQYRAYWLVRWRSGEMWERIEGINSSGSSKIKKTKHGGLAFD